MLDMSIVNSWIRFQKVHGKILLLKDFRAQVAECLCKVHQSHAVKRGRPSLHTEEKLKKKKTRGHTDNVPAKDISLDGYNHWHE